MINNLLIYYCLDNSAFVGRWFCDKILRPFYSAMICTSE